MEEVKGRREIYTKTSLPHKFLLWMGSYFHCLHVNPKPKRWVQAINTAFSYFRLSAKPSSHYHHNIYYVGYGFKLKIKILKKKLTQQYNFYFKTFISQELSIWCEKLNADWQGFKPMFNETRTIDNCFKVPKTSKTIPNNCRKSGCHHIWIPSPEISILINQN